VGGAFLHYTVVGREGNTAVGQHGNDRTPGPTASRMNPVISHDLGITIGIMYGNLLEYELERGRTPADLLRRAVEAFQMALRLNPNLYFVYRNLGRAYRFWGEYELRRGLDPTASLGQALDAYRRPLEVNPNDYGGDQTDGRSPRLESGTNH